MNRTTPVKEKKQKRVPECEDVELEFCQRALSLLTSFYETPSTSEILNFPPAKKVDLPPPEKKVPFNSSVIDLRVRRTQEQQKNDLVNINESIATRVEEMSEVLRSSNVNLDDVFLPEQADRPEKPRYLLNQELDEKAEAERKRTNRNAPLDMETVEKEYKQRLKKSQQKGLLRCQRRMERIKENASKTKPFYKTKIATNTKQPNPEEQKKEIRERTKTYRDPEYYRQYVKTRTPDQKKKYFDSDEE